MKNFIGFILLLCVSFMFSVAANAENMLTFGWSPSTGDGLAGYKMWYGPAPADYTHSQDFGLGDNKPDGSVYYTISQETLTFFDGKFYAALVAYDLDGVESGYSNEIEVDRVPLPLTIPGDYRLEGVQEVSQVTEDTTVTKTYTFFKESVQ